MYVKPRSGENLLKLLFGLIQLIGSTYPKLDVCPNQTILISTFVLGLDGIKSECQ